MDPNNVPIQEPVPPTVAPSVEEKGTPRFVLSILLMVFPPIAIYFMWKEKKYHGWFVSLIVFSALIPLTTYVPLILLLPKLGLYFRNLGARAPNFDYAYPLVIFGIFFSIIQISYGVYVHKIVSRNKFLNKSQLTTIVAILAINVIITIIVVTIIEFSLIMPVFNILHTTPALPGF